MNFSAQDSAAVDGLHAKLSGLGITTDGDPKNISGPGGGYGFGFTDRDGLNYAISSDVAVHSDTEMVGDRPFKLSHVVLNSDKVEDQTDFYRDVLGFRVSDRTERMNFIRVARIITVLPSPITKVPHSTTQPLRFQTLMH